MTAVLLPQCPFHGKIVPRDDSGRPLHPEDRAREQRQQLQRQAGRSGGHRAVRGTLLGTVAPGSHQCGSVSLCGPCLPSWAPRSTQPVVSGTAVGEGARPLQKPPHPWLVGLCVRKQAKGESRQEELIG